MKLFYFTLSFVLFFSIPPKILVAATPHNMIAQKFFETKDKVKKDSCSYCHFTFTDPGNKVWENPPESLKGFGRVGPFCYSCHDGITIVDYNVDASRTAFSPKSHGMDIQNLSFGDSLQNVKLKYIEKETMECTTCHDPHRNEKRPFLVLPLNVLCKTCHQTRINSGFGKKNAESNHPVSVNPSDSSGAPSPIKIIDTFKTPFPQPYLVAGGKFAKGVHWDLGGHLTLGDVGNMECYTCHAVHGDEIKGPNDKLMVADPVREVNDAICEGCHRGVRGDDVKSDMVFPNPGGSISARTYHPVDDDISNGRGRIVDIKEPEGWPFGTNEDKNILCSTCHDVHNALPNSPILRNIKGGTFCEECHADKLQGHHSSGNTSNPKDITFATPGYAWTYESESMWENGNPKIRLESNAEFNGYGVTYGNNVENKIYCSSCHRAHNAGAGVEKGASPSLIIAHTANQLCFLCHDKKNVAFNENMEMTASHFLGDSTLYETFDKPLEYASLYKEKWSETKLKSKYGGDNKREVICESCHSFSENNLNSSEYGYSNNKDMLIARCDEDLEWISQWVENTDYIKDAVEQKAYLCTGCHGECSEGASCHPLMGIDGVMPVGAVINRKANIFPVTYTKNLNINCNSCHYVHKAKVMGGVYMLKEVDGENKDPLKIHPKIDFTILCHYCH
jgi:predicted CXXCH cytochrome family protein